MDIQQQTKNVAAQGRFGDSMLLHVNPAEVKGLASAVPLTINPETGQPEAFLPFLAPLLGSALAPSLLGAMGVTGLSAGAMAGIGAGLATYAQTGGSGSKALLSGLTAGLGTNALNTGAEAAIGNAASDAAIQSATTAGGQTAASLATAGEKASQAAIQAAQEGSKLGVNAAGNFRGFTPGEALGKTFSGGFDSGAQALTTGIMSPSGVAAGVGAGTQGVIASQEEFERQMAQLTEDEEERKRKMYEMYPEQIPMASGGRTGFYHGGTHNPRIDAQRAANNIIFDVPDNSNNSNYGGYNNPYQNSLNLFNTPRVIQRRTRPIGSGFMPGFMPEYSYFESMNPSATALGYDPLGSFQNPQSYQEGYNQSSRGRGSFLRGLFGRGRGMQPLSPPGGFRNEGGYGYTPPPPQFAGYGNPFMQSASYQGFYGVPQMQQMLNPYARFTQQPMPYQPYQPYVPPVETPPDDGGGTGGGGTPPIDPPIDIPGDDRGGRKGAVKNVPPIAPIDDFTNPNMTTPGSSEPTFGTLGGSGYGRFPLGTGGPEYIFDDSGNPVMQPPITMPPMPPSIGRPTPSLPDPIAPPPTVTIPIEGGADVTIPDFSRPQPPRLEPPMSIGGPGGGNITGREELELANTTVGDMMARPPEDLFIQNVETKGPESLRDNYGVQSLASAFEEPTYTTGTSELMARMGGRGAGNIGTPTSINVPGGGGIDYGGGEGPALPVKPINLDVPSFGGGPIPIGQAPQPPQTGGIPVTGGGPLGSGILPVANLPSGPTAPSGPVDPRIGAGIKIPTGPAMGGISAVPTPAAPPQNVGNNPPPMSIGGPGGGRGGIFGAPMFAAGGDTDLPNEGLEALSKTEKGREAVEAMGYQEGGQTDMMQDPVTQDVIMFILGETDDENAINAFVEKYGAEQFMFLRDKILKQAAGNPDAQTEGLIQGDGNSGMADDLPGVIGNKEKIAVSQDEFIVPADVVSMLGDGSSDAGSKQLYNMMDRVRQAKTGGTTQAPPLNPQKVLPA
jgi:hypothetical protein